MTDDRSTPEKKACLAEEWVRDGRGFYAVRTCEHHANGRHGFGSWSYYAKPPHLIRAEAAENTVAAQGAHLSVLQQERDAFREEANAIRRNYLRETKDLAERADAAERQVTSLTAERDAKDQAIASHRLNPEVLRAVFTNEVIRAVVALARQQNVCREQAGAVAFVSGMEAAREYIVEQIQAAHAAPREETP